MSVTYDGGALGNAPILAGIEKPFRHSVYFNDCYDGLVQDAGLGGWFLRELNDSGSEFVGSAVAVDGKGGLVTISPNSGGDSAHDGVQCGMAECFKLDKKFYFETKVSFANVGSFFVGLAVNSNDADYYNGSSVAQPTDRIGFENASAGSTSVSFIGRKDSTDSTVTSVATASATSVRLGFMLQDGVCTVFVDGEKKGTIETNIPDNEEMGAIFAMTSDGSAGVPAVTVDYIYAVQEI
tara:strand:+ start:1716 stop:2429 length:714 start_codon:yes stop_codon:yes gene_type:complete